MTTDNDNQPAQPANVVNVALLVNQYIAAFSKPNESGRYRFSFDNDDQAHEELMLKLIEDPILCMSMVHLLMAQYAEQLIDVCEANDIDLVDLLFEESSFALGYEASR